MIDFTKPVTTRDGRTVRILCTDAPGQFPVCAIIGDFVYRFTMDGLEEYACGYKTAPGLINAPNRIKGWVNVYRYPERNSYWIGRIHNTKEDAATVSGECRVASIYIDIPEGEGL